MAPEVCWQLRSSAPSCRAWMSLYYEGARNDQQWIDVWGLSGSVDLTLLHIYNSHQPDHSKGLQAMHDALLTDDRLEDWLSKLAEALVRQWSGEMAMLDSMPTAQPPGAVLLAPAEAVADAVDAVEVLAQQRGRPRGDEVHYTNDEGDAMMATSLRGPRARRSGGSGSSGAAPVTSSPPGSPLATPAGAGCGGKER